MKVVLTIDVGRLALALVMYLEDAVSETPGIRAGRFSHLGVARLASFRAMARMCSSLLALHAIGDSGTQSSCKNVFTCKMFLLFYKRRQRSITFDLRMILDGPGVDVVLLVQCFHSANGSVVNGLI